MRFVPFALLLILIFSGISAQETTVYTELQKDYMRGVSDYEQGLFNQAYATFGRFLEKYQPVNEADYALLLTHAELYRAKAAIRLDMPQGELMVLNFIQKHRPDPIATEATMEVANYYFNARHYEKAIAYYDLLDPRDLTALQQSEVRFKQGYSHFVRKEFAEAEAQFVQIRDVQNVYYYPSNYYYGMCRFFAADYPEAISSFERVMHSDTYKRYVPYYITQIYFTEQDYDRVIEYAVPKLEDTGLRDKDEMHLLVGQAYFELGDFANALPHLEYHEEHAGAMRAEDFYQLAFVQYHEGHCDRAVENFRHVAHEESALGQKASFYLADCALKAGDLHSARNAFRNVSKMEYDEGLSEEALFQYGKLSAQMQYDFDAINTLHAIEASSPFYSEAQRILRDIFANPRDYGSALETLARMESLSPALKEAHQKLSLLRGIQLLNDRNLDGAWQAFQDARRYPVDQKITAQSYFWLAEIAHYQASYDESIDLYNRYFTLAKNLQELPAESSPAIANYNQGYNYLKQENYVTSLGHFQDAIATMRQDRLKFTDTYYFDQVLPDALLRAGDCLFKRNRYNDALRFYNESIELQKYGYVYAKYQKAIIHGLLNEPFDKIVQLEALVEKHSASQFADDALLQLGITYQEMGSADKALPALKKLIADYPNSSLLIPAYLRMGLISYNNGDLNAATGYYKKVLESNANATEAQEALVALEEIYVQDMSDPETYLNYVESLPGYTVTELKKDSVSYRAAEIQYEQAEYEKAVKAFGDYISRFPNGANKLAALYYRGESLTLLERYDKAFDDFSAVVERGPSAFYHKALQKASTISYHYKKDFDAALTYYRLLVQVTSDPHELFDAQLGVMRSAYRTGNIEEASKAARDVVEHPGATKEEIAEGRYYLGKAAFDAKDYDAALEHFNVVTRHSNNVLTAEARYLIAYIYYLRRQLDLAERLCHNANKESSNYPFWVAKGLILLSDIYVDRNDLLNARAPLEALIENFEGDSALVGEARRKLENIEKLQQEQSRVKKPVDTLEMQLIENDN